MFEKTYCQTERFHIVRNPVKILITVLNDVKSNLYEKFIDIDTWYRCDQFLRCFTPSFVFKIPNVYRLSGRKSIFQYGKEILSVFSHKWTTSTLVNISNTSSKNFNFLENFLSQISLHNYHCKETPVTFVQDLDGWIWIRHCNIYNLYVGSKKSTSNVHKYDWENKIILRIKRYFLWKVLFDFCSW